MKRGALQSLRIKPTSQQGKKVRREWQRTNKQIQSSNPHTQAYKRIKQGEERQTSKSQKAKTKTVSIYQLTTIGLNHTQVYYIRKQRIKQRLLQYTQTKRKTIDLSNDK